MNTLADENYRRWEVEIGRYARDAGGTRLFWSNVGFGCLVHPQIVLTTRQIWEAAENDRRRKSEVMVRVGKEEHACQLGREQKELNLAALVLKKPVSDAVGNAFDLDAVASQSPAPGQTLGVLLQQHLSKDHTGFGQAFICYTFGTVTLLRGQKELLYGLSGLEWQDTSHFGKAVFDPSGKLYGITTEYLKCNFETVAGIRAQTGYLIFSPLTAKIRQAAEQAMKLLR